MGVEDGVGLPRDRRAVRVADRDGARAQLDRVPHRHQRVHGLPGLGDRDDQGVPVDHGVAVAELVGELHLHRDPGPPLDGVLGDRPGIRSRAAGDDHDLGDLPQLVLADAHLVEHQRSVLVGAAQQRVADGVRLLVDLLLHEGLEATLLCGGGVPGHLVGLAVAGGAVEVDHRAGVGGDRDDLVLTELQGVPGVADEGRDVGAQEVLPLPEPDDQR